MTASGNALAAAYDAAGRHEEAINALAVAAREGDAEAMTDLSKRRRAVLAIYPASPV